jgi:hypothetical protein
LVAALLRLARVVGLLLFVLQVPMAFMAATRGSPEFLPGILRAPYEQFAYGIPYYAAAVTVSAAYAVILFMLATRNSKFGVAATGFSILMWVAGLLLLGMESALTTPLLGPKGVKAVFYGNQLWLFWFFFFHWFYIRGAEAANDDRGGAVRSSAELSPVLGK